MKLPLGQSVTAYLVTLIVVMVFDHWQDLDRKSFSTFRCIGDTLEKLIAG